jgi:2-dehydropantoate 2-reductase
MTSLRWLVFGAGAIGTYIGGSLLLSGQRGAAAQHVQFVERPEIAVSLRQKGLNLKLKDGEHHIDAPGIFGSLSEALDAGTYDIALFALKSFDTASAIAGFQGLMPKMPPILCLSNGVDNEPALVSALGAESVIPGTVTSAIGRPAAGNIILERLRGMGVAAGHQLSVQAATALNHAGLNALVFENPAAMKWSKMLTNLVANATSAILDMPPAEVFANLDLYRLEVQMLREALAVMRGLKIPVVNLPGVPVRLMGLGAFLPPVLSRPLFARAAGSGRGSKMPSFHIDLHAGRGQSEVEFLNGAVVREGRKLGIHTPVNKVLNNTLLDLTTGKLAIQDFARQPDKLIALARRARS